MTPDKIQQKDMMITAAMDVGDNTVIKILLTTHVLLCIYKNIIMKHLCIINRP